LAGLLKQASNTPGAKLAEIKALKQDTIVSLQLLRAIAATLVVFGHAQREAEQMSGAFQRIHFPWGFGVDIFFVISGFIMVYTSAKLFAAPGGPRQFITRRLVRIAPLYWVFSLAMLAAVLVLSDQLNSAEFEITNAVASFLFLPSAAPDGQIHPLLEVGWTLNYEMFFYALFAIALLLPIKQGLLALGAAMLAIVVVGFITKPEAAVLAFWSDTIIVEFLFGCAMAYAFLRTGRRPNLLAMALLLAGAAAVFLALAPLQPIPSGRFLAQGIPAAMVVSAAIWFAPSSFEGVIQPFALPLGDSSYSLYLSHPFSLAIFKILWPFNGTESSALWLYVALATIFSICGGLASYYCLERPLLHVLRRGRQRPAQIKYEV
jgi:exopolysaccharide production protein ExoZ